jgi:methylated-DNA-[protein]-cysteine S-methyltransferase
MYRWKTMGSPVGELRLVAFHDQLAAILWSTEVPGRVVLGDDLTEVPGDRTLAEAERQLHEYFEGRRMAFDLALRFGGTPFQRRVWQALLTIPYGETRTYGQIAGQIGSPGAARAVGAANGRNPIAIVTPCHRLLGASGDGLRGFAGGLEAKETLLSLESEAFRTRRLGGRRVFVPASGYTPASWVSR